MAFRPMNPKAGLRFPRFRVSHSQKVMKIVIVVALVAIIASVKAVLTSLLAIRATDSGVGTAADVAGTPIRIGDGFTIDNPSGIVPPIQRPRHDFLLR